MCDCIDDMVSFVCSSTAVRGRRKRLQWWEDVKKNREAASNGIVLRRRLQLMVYNNLYKSMFDKRFESEEDPLYVRVKDLNGQRSRLGLSLQYNFCDFVPILRPFMKGYFKICKEFTTTRLNLFKDHFIGERKKVLL
ncbi:hypothetical protein RD792_018132 [Penstemon davidsonii]|uniref:Uncharacterized protein n=1 Tax=Penstemon davidsonii TaxID=160366 RepID=A0ABR0DV04_9LAMI|nr:hypothetical protein RD792_018132 [Penstemon davidsonii]